MSDTDTDDKNPLLLPRRTEVVELWPGDVEQQIVDLEEQVNEAEGLAEEWETSGAKRANSRNPHIKQADALAKQADALAKSVEPVRLTFREPLAGESRKLRDKFVDEEAEKFDDDGFYSELASVCLVEPEVSKAQWTEFAESVGTFNWRKIRKAMDRLTSQEVSIPKSSLVSELNLRRKRRSELRHGSE